VILVGEIRDQETARIAMQAAQTGHLVLSTLHTDDAPSVMTRLNDIGVEPLRDRLGHRSASSRSGLVRRLCSHCRRQYTPTRKRWRALTSPKRAATSVLSPVGCDVVPQTGYKAASASTR
jgi:type II secretory ATPase GspE/PulE/Tfp pilus assembly ATPase PilB-like protein